MWRVNKNYLLFIFKMLNTTNTLSQLRYSRIQDHNVYPRTDMLYDPLRKILLSPEEVAIHKQYLNPAATHSRVTRDFAYLTPNEIHELRQKTLIPVDQQLYATQNFQKVQNSRFMVVDANERIIGAPISAEEMQRIRIQGLKEERVVYDFGQAQTVEPIPPPDAKVIKPPPIQQTKIIKQQLKTSYRPPEVEEYKPKNKYKYNLYSMLDQQVNGGGCGCPSNEIIASRNEPQSINWLN